MAAAVESVRPHRRARQQRRQLLRRVLRGDLPRRLPGTDRDQPVRPGERHPRRASRHACAAPRTHRDDLLDRRHLRAGVLSRPTAAAKFGVEGWIESLAPEVAPFGIRTMLVEPGFFRTELLTDESTKWPEASIDDYAERTRQTVTAWKKMSGLQGGDPAKLAKALVQLASQRRAPAALARRRRRRRDLREEGQGVARPGQRPPDAVLVARARRRSPGVGARVRVLQPLFSAQPSRLWRFCAVRDSPWASGDASGHSRGMARCSRPASDEFPVGRRSASEMT